MAAFARCAFAGTVSIAGAGPYALLTCRPVAVSLWPTYPRALNAKQALDGNGCGWMCRGDHEIVVVRFDEAAVAA